MHVVAITLTMRLIDAFRMLEAIYLLTFGGPGNSTEILALHICNTAFIGQQLGVAAAVLVVVWWWWRPGRPRARCGCPIC